MILKKAWATVSALAWWVVTLPLDIIGAVVVPFAIWFGHEQDDITGTKKIFSAPKCLWLWGNQQEGYDPPWAMETLYKGWGTFRRRYSWAAWRNRTSNLRFLGFLKVDPTKVKVTKQGNHTIWQYKGWVLWEWLRKKRYSKLGLRMTQDWTAKGTNFAVVFNRKY